ncbi:MAG: sulfotransferase domain-containing protein [Pseudomonadota bacterium]
MTKFIADLQQRTGADVFYARGPRSKREEDTFVFHKEWQPRAYPRARIVKDHRPLERYLWDDGYLLVRDGRDCMVSLAWMTREAGNHRFWLRSELAEFIKWTMDSYRYGSWADHTKRLLRLLHGGSKQLVRYEEASAQLDRFKGAPADVRRKWGIVDDDLTGSMFEAWQQSRGKSNWRASFDRAAAKAFHNTGATEMLIELGYETDPDWWKQV